MWIRLWAERRGKRKPRYGFDEIVMPRRLPRTGTRCQADNADTTKASSFACVADSDDDDNQPPAPKYLNDRHNCPIVPIDDEPGDDDKC